MKHRVENNEIVESVDQIPVIREKDRSTFFGYNLLSESALYADGWRDEIVPSFDPVLKKLSAPYYSAFHDIVIYDVIDRTDLPTLQEAKSMKTKESKQQANMLLSKTDWYVTRFSETGTTIPDAVKEERQSIRSRSNVIDTEINSKTDLRDILVYEITY